MRKVQTVYASAYVAALLMLSSCATSAPAYVHTVGPTGYWNAHCETDRCMVATDPRPGGMIKFRYVRTTPGTDTVQVGR